MNAIYICSGDNFEIDLNKEVFPYDEDTLSPYKEEDDNDDYDDDNDEEEEEE